MSRSCWWAQAGHQMSLCVEHMACCLFGAMCSHVDCLSCVSCEFHVDCAPVFCLPACLFFPFGVVFVVHLFHFIIKTLIFRCIGVLDLISRDMNHQRTK